VRHATILEMGVESYRRKATLNRKRRGTGRGQYQRRPGDRAVKSRTHQNGTLQELTAITAATVKADSAASA
jgi:hypothetical protein